MTCIELLPLLVPRTGRLNTLNASLAISSSSSELESAGMPPGEMGGFRALRLGLNNGARLKGGA